MSETESSFRSEIQTKQSLVDQAHAKLRETTSQLNKERQRLAQSQRAADERKALRQRISNLRQANDGQRAILFSNTPADKSIRTDVRVGEADAGLEIDETVLPPVSTNSLDHQSPLSTLTPSQQNYLSSLPPAAILRARASAYKQINATLEEQTKTLQSQSSELEDKLRKVVSLCTGVDEAKVDEMVDGLVQAVESEGGDDVEVGRVREFLRKVEAVE